MLFFYDSQLSINMLSQNLVLTLGSLLLFLFLGGFSIWMGSQMGSFG